MPPCKRSHYPRRRRQSNRFNPNQAMNTMAGAAVSIVGIGAMTGLTIGAMNMMKPGP